MYGVLGLGLFCYLSSLFSFTYDICMILVAFYYLTYLAKRSTDYF